MSISHRIKFQERKSRKKVSYDENESLNERKEQLECYRWSLKENYSYLVFLQNNKEMFSLKKGAKKRKGLFQLMAQHLDFKRNNAQCRTHHEKMVKKYRVQDQSEDILPIIIGMRNTKAIQEYAKSIQLKEMKGCEKVEESSLHLLSLKKGISSELNQGDQKRESGLSLSKQIHEEVPVKIEEKGFMDKIKISQKKSDQKSDPPNDKKQEKIEIQQEIKVEEHEGGTFNQVKRKECTDFLNEQVQNQFSCFNPYFLIFPYFSPDVALGMVKKEQDM